MQYYDDNLNPSWDYILQKIYLHENQNTKTTITTIRKKTINVLIEGLYSQIEIKKLKVKTLIKDNSKRLDVLFGYNWVNLPLNV